MGSAAATDLDSRDRERNGSSCSAESGSLSRRRRDGKNLSGGGMTIDDSIEEAAVTRTSCTGSAIHQSQAFNNEGSPFCRSAPHRRTFHSRRRISLAGHMHQPSDGNAITADSANYADPYLDADAAAAAAEKQQPGATDGKNQPEERKGWHGSHESQPPLPLGSMNIAAAALVVSPLVGSEESERTAAAVSPVPESSASSSGFSSTSSASVTPDRHLLKQDLLTQHQITNSDFRSEDASEHSDGAFDRSCYARRSRLPVRTNELTSLPLTRLAQRASSAPAAPSLVSCPPTEKRFPRHANRLTADPALNSVPNRSSFRVKASPSVAPSTSSSSSYNFRSRPAASGNPVINASLRYQTPLPKTSLVMRTTARNAFSPVANFRRSSLVSGNKSSSVGLRSNGRTMNKMEQPVVVPSKTASHLNSLSNSHSPARSSSLSRKPSFTCEFRSFMKQTSSSAAKALRNY